jgi:hypothetical protein
MKKLLGIFVSVALMSFCSATFAETPLTDNELGELYAGRHGHHGLSITFSEVEHLTDSAAVAQNNVGAVVVNGNSNTATIEQNNAASVNAHGTLNIDNSVSTKVIDKSIDVSTGDIALACKGGQIGDSTVNKTIDSNNTTTTTTTTDVDVTIDDVNVAAKGGKINTGIQKHADIDVDIDDMNVATGGSKINNGAITNTSTEVDVVVDDINFAAKGGKINTGIQKDTEIDLEDVNVATGGSKVNTGTQTLTSTKTITTNETNVDVTTGDIAIDAAFASKGGQIGDKTCASNNTANITRTVDSYNSVDVNKTANLNTTINADLDLNKAVNGSTIATSGSEAVTNGGNTGKIIDVSTIPLS